MKDIEMNDIELNEFAAAEETNGMAADEAAKTEETSAQGNNEASEEAAGEASETGAKEKNTEKKGFFSKKKDKKDEQIEELTDRLKRTMAEFDNFRKRTEKEKAAMYEIGAKDIVERILPVMDNFERGLAAIPEAEVKSAFAEGMDILTLLTTIGVVPSRSEGRRAVQQGGVKLAEKPVTDVDFKVTADLFTDGKLLVQKGKKTFHNVVLK